jgi:DNA-binding MurR/RpiR family transcriptional regulator
MSRGWTSRELGVGMSVLEELVAEDLALLEQLRRSGQGEQLDQVARMVGAADLIFLLASASAFPVACYLAYALTSLGLRNVLVTDVGGMLVEQLSSLTTKDLLFVVESGSCVPAMSRVIDSACKRGIPVALLAGSTPSVLSKYAQARVATHPSKKGTPRSLAVLMTLSLTLIVAVGRRRTANAKGTVALAQRSARAARVTARAG